MYPFQLHKKINLLFLGLKDSGKSFTIHSIAGRCAEEISPNVSRKMIKDGGFYVEMTEVHDHIEDYFVETHGVVFCLDRTSNTEEAKKLLRSMLMHPKINKKPALVMTTKMKVNSDFGMEIGQGFDNILHHPPTKLVETGRIKAKDLKREFHKWLKMVKRDFPQLTMRVEDDITQRDIIRRRNNEKTDHFIYKTTTTSSTPTITSIRENADEALHPAAGYPEKSHTSSASKGTSINMRKDKTIRPVPSALLPADARSPFLGTIAINLHAADTILTIDSKHTASIGSSINLKRDKTLRPVPAALLPADSRSSTLGSGITEPALSLTNIFKGFQNSMKRVMKNMKLRK